jgi:hypothetical protein
MQKRQRGGRSFKVMSQELAVTISRLAETKVRERLPLVSRRTKDSWSPGQDSAQLERETMN